MFCKNCGNSLNDNARFCEKCGTSAEPQQNNNPNGAEKMSKKQYFASSFCTETSKKFITANWIIFAVLAVYLVFSIVTTAASFSMVFSAVDLDGGLVHFFEQLEDISGESMGFTEEELATLNEFEELTGISGEDFIETIIYMVIAFMIVAIVAIILFSLFSVLKKSTGLAITALVLTVLFAGALIAIGLSIAILVMTVKLNAEYKQYSDNFLMFGTTSGNGFSEPDFRA